MGKALDLKVTGMTTEQEKNAFRLQGAFLFGRLSQLELASKVATELAAGRLTEEQASKLTEYTKKGA